MATEPLQPAVPNDSLADHSESAGQVPEEQRSFGTFKPVGHVLIGLPQQADKQALTAALRDAGHHSDLVWVTPSESVDELQRMIDDASPLAGFGYEITVMRRLVELSRSGHRFLLVAAQDDDDAAQIGEHAKYHGATMAVRYGKLVLEELI